MNHPFTSGGTRDFDGSKPAKRLETCDAVGVREGERLDAGNEGVGV